MSPEQADPTAMDIDTRSDVYALGVMLYELLTGSPPIDARQFKRGAILEMLRMVREVEPPRPSTKLSTAEALPNVAANRSIEPTKLARLLRGELDWVVMKAIEKDRTRRYETANAFIRDIQRYLADEVVEARPPSRGYRLKKFVKRNRGQVLAASLVLLALVGGVVGTTIGLLQANAAAQKERDANGAAQAALTAAENAAKAEAAAKITAQNAAAAETVAKLDAQNAVVREKAANERTQRRLAQIEKGVEQLAGLLEGINPRNEELGGPPVYQQLRERAEQAADALDADAVGDPLAVARLQGIYGNTLRELGNAAKAVELLEKARATLERESGADQPDTLRTFNNLAYAYQADGRTTQAIELFEQVQKARVKILGPDHPLTVKTLSNLGLAYQADGRTTQAIELHAQARDALVKKLGPDHTHTLTTLNNLAYAYQDAGRTAQAIELHTQVRDVLMKKLGPDHKHTLTTLNNLGLAYQAAGRTTQAIELFEQVRDARVKILGPDHPETLTTLNNLGLAYQADGRTAQAIELLEKVRDASVKKLTETDLVQSRVTDRVSWC
jgi:tetratricopeptide (TPR) repeat protein